MPNEKLIFDDLSAVQKEHYTVAEGFSGEFTRRQFVEAYRASFPDRALGSILPSDFSFNNNQENRSRYPAFLITEAPSVYRFVGLGHDGPGDDQWIGALSRRAFEEAMRRLNHDLRAYDSSRFKGFDTGVLHRWESYKATVREIALSRLSSAGWRREDIGTGKILDGLIHAIEIKIKGGVTNNLVAWESRANQPSATQDLRYLLSMEQKRGPFERVIYDLFRSEIAHEVGLARLVELIGQKYSIIGYIFFLIDDRRYLPIAARTFDEAFRKLEIRLVTSGRCSWENYLAYNEAIGWVRDAMQSWEGYPETTLLDAHSLLWVMVRLPLENARRKEQGGKELSALNRMAIELGQGIVGRVGQANGQREERIVKNKELHGFSSHQKLYEAILEMWEEQKGLCALTGHPMAPYVETGEPNDMKASVDRIDSDAHYSRDNMQLVCWFANRWKGTSSDADFKKLIAIVRDYRPDGGAPAAVNEDPE